MRKWLCLICALCLLAGAAAAGEGTDFYTDLNRQAQTLARLNAEAAGVCDAALSDLKAFASAYAEALDAQGAYDLDGYKAKLVQRGLSMDGCASRLQTLREGLSLMSAADDRQEAALRACRDYADEALAAVNAFRRTNAFQQAQYAASAPLDELSKGAVAAENKFVTAYEWEQTAAGVYSDFCALTPPDCLASAWAAYVKQVRLFAAMCRMQREGIGFDDVMQLYSASQLLARESAALAKYEFALYELYYRSYERAGERLAFLKQGVEPALLAACANGGEAAFDYTDRRGELSLSYRLADEVYPNLYHTMDAVVILDAHTEWGARDILVTAQIEGFSQEYRRKLTVGTDLTRLTIKPPMLAQVPSLFNTRDTQLSFSVTDALTGELLAQESATLTLHSLYDYQLRDNEFGMVQYYDILSWLTPESEGVLRVRREAIRWLEAHTDMTTLAGYQNVIGAESGKEYLNTRLQAIGLQAAISDLGVRYNWGAYTLSAFQRVLMPDAVIDSQSGICIETSILLASALKSTGMHALILFSPGHAQVALETWRNSHEYYLLETTALPFDGTDEAQVNHYIQYKTQAEWEQYLADCAARGVAYVVDCDLLNTFGYQAMYSGQ